MNGKPVARNVPFSDRPGRHERHFRRRLEIPLMPRPIRDYGDDDLLEVQRLDHEELVAFIEELQGLVVKAIQLPPNVDSEVVLALKEQLDRAYETSAGMADDQSGNQSAIRDLTSVIMTAIRRNASGDSFANGELALEDAAREAHYEMLQHPLISDLLDPDSLIQQDELLPVLLGESLEALTAAVELFDDVQLGDIVARANDLVARVPDDPGLQQRLELLYRKLAERANNSLN